jgi:hypothetical protein
VRLHGKQDARMFDAVEAKPVPHDATRRRGALVLLSVVCGASLCLTTVTNRYAGVGLRHVAPGFAWLAQAAVPSLLASLALYVGIRPARPLALPMPATNWRRVIRVSALWLTVWLTGSVLVALISGRWVAYTHGAAPVAAFLVCGLVGEELLFRGTIFELSERAVPQWPEAPLLVSSVFFSLQHFQFHQFQLSGAALGQVAFTFRWGWSSAACVRALRAFGPASASIV